MKKLRAWFDSKDDHQILVGSHIAAAIIILILVAVLSPSVSHYTFVQ